MLDRLTARVAARLGGTRSRRYRLDVAVEALDLIARGGTYGADYGCERLTAGPGACREWYARGAPGYVDAWCPPCIAFDALQRIGQEAQR